MLSGMHHGARRCVPLAWLGAQLQGFLCLCAVQEGSLLRGHQQHLVTVLHLNHTRGLLQQQDRLTHPLHTHTQSGGMRHHRVTTLCCHVFTWSRSRTENTTRPLSSPEKSFIPLVLHAKDVTEPLWRPTTSKRLSCRQTGVLLTDRCVTHTCRSSYLFVAPR